MQDWSASDRRPDSEGAEVLQVCYQLAGLRGHGVRYTQPQQGPRPLHDGAGTTVITCGTVVKEYLRSNYKRKY